MYYYIHIIISKSYIRNRTNKLNQCNKLLLSVERKRIDYQGAYKNHAP